MNWEREVLGALLQAGGIRRNPACPVVYFVGAEGTDLVKIGCTGDPAARLIQLRTAHNREARAAGREPYELAILGMGMGWTTGEAALQFYYEKRQVSYDEAADLCLPARNEWYRLGRRSRALIRTLTEWTADRPGRWTAGSCAICGTPYVARAMKGMRPCCSRRCATAWSDEQRYGPRGAA